MVEELRSLGNADEILLIDQRNHGDSAVENAAILSKGPPSFTIQQVSFFWFLTEVFAAELVAHDWEVNGSDVLNVIRNIYGNGHSKVIIGIGHSGQ